MKLLSKPAHREWETTKWAPKYEAKLLSNFGMAYSS